MLDAFVITFTVALVQLQPFMSVRRRARISVVWIIPSLPRW
jgi:MlaD protein